MKGLTRVVEVERDFRVSERDPLSRWEPNDLSELVVAQDSIEKLR